MILDKCDLDVAHAHWMLSREGMRHTLPFDWCISQITKPQFFAPTVGDENSHTGRMKMAILAARKEEP